MGFLVLLVGCDTHLSGGRVSFSIFPPTIRLPHIHLSSATRFPDETIHSLIVFNTAPHPPPPHPTTIPPTWNGPEHRTSEVQRAYTATKIPFKFFQKRNCASSVPISTFSVSVRDLSNPRIGPHIFLQQNRQTHRRNIQYKSLTDT
jgi:hypothetical protein